MIEPYGIILAGGRARRMGGLDKARLHLADRPLIERVARRLRPQCDALLVSANGDPHRFASLGLPVVADEAQAAFAGPLAGILACLDHIASRTADAGFAVSVPADTPFLPLDLVARLVAARRARHCRAAFATSAGRAHPVVALWPVDLRHDLRQALLGAGHRKVAAFLAGYSCATADWPAMPLDPFFNVNTPGDLHAAESLAQRNGCD
jgi:molybdopterin-guanine dinucleotide biosynthesis protein A